MLTFLQLMVKSKYKGETGCAYCASLNKQTSHTKQTNNA